MNKLTILLLLVLSFGCGEKQDASSEKIPKPLPYLGDMGKDHLIPPFKFLNQDSIWKTNDDFKNKVWVVEFFFYYLRFNLPNNEKANASFAKGNA